MKNMIRDIFFPFKEKDYTEFKETLPFFAFAIFILGWLYFQVINSSPVLTDPVRRSFFTGLYAVHLVMYIFVFRFVENERGKIYYVILQGVLAFIIIMLCASLTTSIGLYSALIGNIIGLMGRNRRTVFGIVFYLILLAINALTLNAYESLREWLPMSIVAMIFAGVFAYFLHMQLERREKDQKMLKELEKAHLELADYAVQMESLTLANERQRMARELHDTLAQGLAGLILQLEAALVHVEKGDTSKSSAILNQSMGRARLTLKEAREVIDDLRAGDQGALDLEVKIHQEVERFIQATGIPLEMNLAIPDLLKADICEHVSRIVSEGLSNIARHAKASHAGIDIHIEQDHLIVQIWDDGIGFDTQETLRSGHYGIIGIRERTRLAGGEMTIQSESDEGTILSLSIPFLNAAGGEKNE